MGHKYCGRRIVYKAHRMRELHPDLNLPTAQLIIRKGFHQHIDSYSAFMEADQKTSTGLAGYLRERGIDIVFVVGIATDFCVAWTAMDARKLGFETFVIADLTKGIDLQGSFTACMAGHVSKWGEAYLPEKILCSSMLRHYLGMTQWACSLEKAQWVCLFVSLYFKWKMPMSAFLKFTQFMQKNICDLGGVVCRH